MKHYGLLVILLLVTFGSTQVHGVRYTKDNYNAHYQTLLVRGFPRQVNNRTVMTQWCKAITNVTVPGDGRSQLSGFVYSGVTIAPTQSVLAYMFCHPFLDKSEINRFSKQIISTVKTLDISSLIVGFDKKNCELANKRNDLTDCNLIRNNQDIASMLFDDYYNVRLGAAWGYRSINKEDRGYLMVQHFAYASGETFDQRIADMNTIVCRTPQIAILGPTKTQWCGFPLVYAEVETNAVKGKNILNNTKILDGEKILLSKCDDISGDTNKLGCAINDLQTTQAFMSQIHNELWVYNQRKTMYQILININPEFAIGNRQGVNNEQARNLVNQIENRLNQHHRLLEQSIDYSTQLMIKFEPSYYTHLGNSMLLDANMGLVGRQVSTMSDNIARYSRDRLHTQKSSSS